MKYADDRFDQELGVTVRRCRRCCEWWPLELEFYPVLRAGVLRSVCKACRSEQEHNRPTPKRATTHGPMRDELRRREQERARKAALRRDPVFGERMRARQRKTQRRYYLAHREEILAKRRAKAAELRGGPPRPGFGRPVGSYAT